MTRCAHTGVHARGRRSARPARRAGFTLIEIMVSLGIMTLGAMAVMALLAQIIRSNGYARQLNTAVSINQAWIERLKQDGSRWVQAAAPSGAPTPANVLTNTVYLRNVTAPPSATFQVIPATTAVTSAAFDYQGNDVALVGTPDFFYCAAYRANWIYFGRTMRVDVRVFWPRAGSGAVIVDDWPACDGDHTRLDPGGALIGNYHVVYLSTALGVTPVIR